jgi:hypothetical protein
VIAKFRFNVKNEWLDGAHNRSIINGFHGAMQDIERSQSFQLHADEQLSCSWQRCRMMICSGVRRDLPGVSREDIWMCFPKC